MGSFYGKGIYLSDDAWNPNIFISELSGKGIGYVLLEDTPHQRSITDPSIIQTLRNAGFNPGVWWRENSAGGITPQQSIDYWGVFTFIADLESAQDRVDFISLTGGPQAFANANPGKNLAVSATDPAFQTGGVYDPSLSAPWITAGWRVHPQTYTNQDPNATVPGQIFAYRNQLCWPFDWIFPSLGTWGGYDASNYCPQLAQAPGCTSWNLYYYQGLHGSGTLQQTLDALKACGSGGLWQSRRYVPSQAQFATFQSDPTFGSNGQLTNTPSQRPCGPGLSSTTPQSVYPLEGPNDSAYAFANVSANQSFGTKIGGFGLGIPSNATITRVRLVYTFLVDISAGKQGYIAWFTPDGSSHQRVDNGSTSPQEVTHDVTGDRSWVPADFAEPGFYVSVGGKNNSGPVSGVYVDSVQVLVDFTLPSAPPPPPDKTDQGRNTVTVAQPKHVERTNDSGKNTVGVQPRGSGYICNPGPCAPPLIDSGVNTQAVAQRVVKEARSDSGRNTMVDSQKGVAFIPGSPTAVPQLWPCSPTGTISVYSNGGFTNPGNVCQNDGVYATALPVANNGRGNAYGHYGLDALVPVGASIIGVQVVAQFKVNFVAGGGCFVRLKARVGGVELANHDSPTPANLLETTFTADVTGDRAWTRADLLDASFETILEARRGNAIGNITVSVDYLEVIVTYVLVNAHDSGRNTLVGSPAGQKEAKRDQGRNTQAGSETGAEKVADSSTAVGAGGQPFHAVVLRQSTPTYQSDQGVNPVVVAGKGAAATVDAGRNTQTGVPAAAKEAKRDTGQGPVALTQTGLGQVKTHPRDQGANAFAVAQQQKRDGLIDKGRSPFALVQNQQLPFWMRPVPFVPPGQLGCGTYEVAVFTRGGSDFIGTLPWGHVEWGRILNDTSDASVTVNLAGASAECCDILSQLRNWKHELAIYRDEELIWAGPVVGNKHSLQSGQAVLAARDLSSWLDRRLINYDHVYGSNLDLAVIFQEFIRDAMSVDNTPGLYVAATESLIQGNHSVLAAEHKLAGPEIRSLSQMGIDWTMVVRSMIAGGLVVPTDSLGTLVDHHFATPPDINDDGLQQENYTGIRGQGGGGGIGDPVYGYASSLPSQAEFGVLANVQTDSLSSDSVLAQALAESRQASLAQPVVIVEEGDLAPAAPFPLSTLVPGAEVELVLSSGCRKVQEAARLGYVKGSITASTGQDAGVEKITVGFIPVGTVVIPHHLPPRPVVTGG